MLVTRAGADQISSRISLSRRDLLRAVIGASLYPFSSPAAKAANAIPAHSRKAVVITFGGGARDDETFAPDGLENIPHLLNDLMPQATFFTRVVNEGILGHYVATASIACGTYEKFNNFAAVLEVERYAKDKIQTSSDFLLTHHWFNPWINSGRGRSIAAPSLPAAQSEFANGIEPVAPPIPRTNAGVISGVFGVALIFLAPSGRVNYGSPGGGSSPEHFRND